jgi:hypothetical protein
MLIPFKIYVSWKFYQLLFSELSSTLSHATEMPWYLKTVTVSNYPINYFLYKTCFKIQLQIVECKDLYMFKKTKYLLVITKINIKNILKI